MGLGGFLIRPSLLAKHLKGNIWSRPGKSGARVAGREGVEIVAVMSLELAGCRVRRNALALARVR